MENQSDWSLEWLRETLRSYQLLQARAGFYGFNEREMYLCIGDNKIRMVDCINRAGEVMPYLPITPGEQQIFACTAQLPSGHWIAVDLARDHEEIVSIY